MERKELLSKIENKSLENIYLVYGKESLLIREIEEVFKTLADPSVMDFNMTVVDGKETNLEELRSAIETLPFMDEKRYVIIKDFELLKGKRKNFSESDEKEFVEIIKSISKTTVLVFLTYGEIDKKKSVYKSIEKNGVVSEFKKLDDLSLLSWCKEEFIKRNAEISNSDVTYLIELSGYRDRTSEITLSDLENDIEKISSYVGKGNSVTKNDINTLLHSKSENDIFQLIDMIGSKNSKRSMKILLDMLDGGESVLGIFAMLSRQFNQILQVKYLQEDKLPHNLIKSTLKMHPYTFNKVVRQVKNYDEKSIISLLNYISDSDYKIKNGLIDDRLAVEILITKYCV
ncbi:DNA polymerase III subunit delta [Peptostreptococcus faecalis]|uniref:DNA polymerase III subunit delta n=1 Tax=Peptostreptococcus faecalis TaxID=2045015 RepID=UPI000C7C8C71|nr:DNA polymerase III subunit delta [Peptostreptococcus faecalis]